MRLVLEYLNTVTLKYLGIIKSLRAFLPKIKYSVKQNLLLITTLEL